MTENKKLNEVELVVVDTNVAVEEVGPQCGQPSVNLGTY